MKPIYHVRTNLNTLLIFFQKRSLWFSLLTFSSIFIIARLPYILYAPIPSYGTDTFDYFWIAQYIIEGRCNQMSDIIYDLPIGYPVFISLCYFIDNSLAFIVKFQFFLSLMSGFYLIYSFHRVHRYLGLGVVIPLLVYMLDGFTLSNDTTIFTKSLYTSSLIASIGAYVVLSVHFCKRNLVIFTCLIMIPPTIRSEGIIVFSLIIFVLLQYREQFKIIRKYLFLPFVVLNLGLSGFNLYSKGYFFPGNIDRIKYTLNRTDNKLLNNKYPSKMVKTVPASTFRERVGYYINNFTVPYWHFYYHTLPDRYDRISNNQINYYAFDFRLPVSEKLKKMAIKEYMENRMIKKYSNFFAEKSFENSVLVRFYYILNTGLNKLFLNQVTLYLYIIVSLINVFLLFKKDMNKMILWINAINSIHILNLVIISYTIPAMYRVYIHTTEFIPLIVIMISGYYFFNNIKSKKRLLNAQ